MMNLFTRPWSKDVLSDDFSFGPDDCLFGEFENKPPNHYEYTVILNGNLQDRDIKFVIFPYPKRDSDSNLTRTGFPLRPDKGNDPVTLEEKAGADALKRMNDVLARIQDFKEALDSPHDTWNRLRANWKHAEDRKQPRMAEIVHQSHGMGSVLQNLSTRIRRVLRRQSELVPLDRVQEMDRSSMIWLSRQPGRNTAERAGSNQRIRAIVRKENFDTLENRVLHSYSRLAHDVAREWMREHPYAKESKKYRDVHAFQKKCRSSISRMVEHNVSLANAGIIPNYVLMHDRNYHTVLEAWERLLDKRKAGDDLWAWQANTWIDFSVLTVILAINEISDAHLIAQSPILWRDEGITGRIFEWDHSIVVFRFSKADRIVEILARPEKPDNVFIAARANMEIRIFYPRQTRTPRRVMVWTPHAMNQININKAVKDVSQLLRQINNNSSSRKEPTTTHDSLHHGLVLTPAHKNTRQATSNKKSRIRVKVITLGASAKTLTKGLDAVHAFVKNVIYEDFS